MDFLHSKKTVETGKYSETIAKKFLSEQGLQYITSNYRCRIGEIDLIFQGQDCLIFVEVRYRYGSNYGSPLESITMKKQKKIIKTAQYYLQKKKLFDRYPCRFDVVSIKPSHQEKTPDIEWIRDAFWL